MPHMKQASAAESGNQSGLILAHSCKLGGCYEGLSTNEFRNRVLAHLQQSLLGQKEEGEKPFSPIFINKMP